MSIDSPFGLPGCQLVYDCDVPLLRISFKPIHKLSSISLIISDTTSWLSVDEVIEPNDVPYSHSWNTISCGTS